MKQRLLPILTIILISPQLLASTLEPKELLGRIYNQSPELASKRAEAEAEDNAVSSKYSLSNPRVGLMNESEMRSWTLSQEVMFPTKYFSMGSMQKSKARVAHEEFLDKKLEVRQRALTQYFNFYSNSRIVSLLEAQRETLREIARIAEARRATGAVPQQDEMKAHVEQTKIENEILLMNQDVVEAKVSLNAILNQSPDEEIVLPTTEFKAPRMNLLENKTDASLSNSKMLASQRASLDEANKTKTYAKMSYLPDFTLSYKKPFGTNAPENAYTFGIEMTIPLWFFAKQTSEVSEASSRVVAAEYKLQQVRRQVEAEAKTLTSKAKALSELLKIYETALIPQSTSTLNSSRAAYSAGRVGFQELLDAERSLYSVRIDYYKNLAKYIETLAALERTIGESVSDLPFDGEGL